jgi:hypothetical protein
MAKKKSGAKKLLSKGKAKKKKAARKTKATGSLKPSRQKKTAGKKVRSAVKKRRSSRPASKEIRSPEPSTLAGGTFRVPPRRSRKGQAGDAQGLSRKQVVDSESVEELLEEGQTYEAEAISGVEDALEPDQGEVQTHEVLEDDVPEEYTDED